MSNACLRVIGCLRTLLGHAEQVFVSPPPSLYTHRTRCTPDEGDGPMASDDIESEIRHQAKKQLDRTIEI
jgi:hypothetical protein